MKNFKTLFLITEPNIEGKYDSEAYEYILMTDHKPNAIDIQDIIYQACEIERIGSELLLVEMIIEKDGEYHDWDQFEVKIHIELTNELSQYINWNKCKSLPPIYAVDKIKSSIEVLW